MPELEKMARLGRLSSGIFHDLTNPLTAAKLNLAELSKLLKNFSPACLITQRVSKSINRMETLLVSIRKQLEAERPDKPFCVNRIIREVRNLLQYQARISNVQIIFRQSENIIATGDEVKFYQITQNLLINAIESYYTCPDRNERPIQISLEKRDDTYCLMIKDEGAGIDSSVLDKIYRPCFTTKSPRNLGLGLSRVKEMVEQDFNGWITVQSQKGMGSVFKVYWPVIQKKISPSKSLLL